MILTLISPKGGVGASTVALMLARAWQAPLILVDAAADPALDLYTGTEHHLQEPYSGSLTASAWELETSPGLSLVRVEPEQLPALAAELPTGTDVLIDLGVAGPEGLAFLNATSARVLVVLTQDNQVLRAADALLGRLRQSGIRAGFILNRFEARDVNELADLDEIFGLIEEDFYGSIDQADGLRILLNQGRGEAIPTELMDQARTIRDRICQGTEEPIAAPDASAAAPPDAPAPPTGVLARIRRFVTNFGKETHTP